MHWQKFTLSDHCLVVRYTAVPKYTSVRVTHDRFLRISSGVGTLEESFFSSAQPRGALDFQHGQLIL